MNDQLATAVVVLSLAVAAWSLVLVALDRPVGRPLLGAVALLEVTLLGLAVVGTAAVVGTDRDIERVTLVGYLVGALVVPPAAALWALGERTRYGTAVLVVAGLVLPVMVLRMQQIWTGTGA